MQPLRSVPAGIGPAAAPQPVQPSRCPKWSPCSILAALIINVGFYSQGAIAQESGVDAAELTESNWDQLIPAGKEVDAIYGDVVLQNKHLRAVIARPVATRNANMTVRSVGGCLIDLTARHHESDQLSAFYPGRRADSFTEPATIESAAPGQSRVRMMAGRSSEKPDVSVEYSLGSDSRFLTIKSEWQNNSDKELSLTLEDDLRADGGKEDMQKAPNGKHDLYWFQDVYWQQAYGIHVPGFVIRSNSNARESVLSYETSDGKPIVLQPGGSFTLTRHVFVEQHLAGVMAEYQRSQNAASELRDVTLSVLADGKPVAHARVSLSRGEETRGSVMTDSSGKASVSLPEGEWNTTVKVAGIEYESNAISAGAQSDVAITLNNYYPGIAKISIADGEGHLIPAKVQFKGAGAAATPNFGPESAEFFVQNVAYTHNGQVETPLAAGEYDVTILRGPEYHAEFTKLKIEAGKTSELSVRLPRVVSTPGWISADFHSHSSPSGDNTSSQKGRVLNLVAEHVEFAPCTEHNRISTYSDHIASLGLQSFLATVSGMELTGTPLPLNHQNVFPLLFRPRTQDGGAPVTDASPETQIERIAAWDNNSPKLIQQNHPDIGWLFYDRDGNQKPDEGYSRSFGLMNVMEIHPIDPLLNPTQYEFRDGKPIGNQTCVNWLQLLNQGFRIYGVVNTDCHYNFHGSGGLRLWLKSSTDDPRMVTSDEMRDSARGGQILMSNGPYLEATFAEDGSEMTVVSGQDLMAKSKKVSAKLRVQCPNWLDVDTVFVLVNGRRHPGLEWTRESHPDKFTSGKDDIIRFDQTVTVDLKEDAHLIVVAGHRTQLIGDLMGPLWGNQHPTAVTNPVFVDLDGDGFSPNRDTLDFPLPVKFAAPSAK
ncbi:MAG: CehA/McbA family metallohydrolase [Planctomycetota bacterium]